MTEEQLTLVNIIRQTVYAYSLTLEDDRDKSKLYINFGKFCEMNEWDLSRFKHDSLTNIMDGIHIMAGLLEGLGKSKENEEK